MRTKLFRLAKQWIINFWRCQTVKWNPKWQIAFDAHCALQMSGSNRSGELVVCSRAIEMHWSHSRNGPLSQPIRFNSILVSARKEQSSLETQIKQQTNWIVNHIQHAQRSNALFIWLLSFWVVTHWTKQMRHIEMHYTRIYREIWKDQTCPSPTISL